MTADAEVPVKLLPGVVGKVVDTDKDGDAYVDFATLFKHLTTTQCWVSARSFEHMMVQVASRRHSAEHAFKEPVSGENPD